MADEDKVDDQDQRRPARSTDADVQAFTNRRQKPKAVTRAPADKMLRPGVTCGYETK